jgi:hypothetical protein
MQTSQTLQALAILFAELTDGAAQQGGAFTVNAGDVGLLRSLDGLSPGEASRSVHGGATVAAHAQHLRYGLSLMNRWAAEGGNPFANALWDEAWKINAVNADQWAEIRGGLRDEAHRWRAALSEPREVTTMDLTGMIASVVHLAYHLGAIRQIASGARGPTEGTFA